MTSESHESGAIGKVLIVDDSPAVLELTSAILEEAGYEVLTMESALRLPVVVRREKPDVVLLDVKLPTLKGDKALRLCRELHLLDDTAVVFYSDSSESELEAMVKGAGAAGFLKKSPTSAALLQGVRTWVAWARSRKAFRKPR